MHNYILNKTASVKYPHICPVCGAGGHLIEKNVGLIQDSRDKKTDALPLRLWVHKKCFSTWRRAKYYNMIFVAVLFMGLIVFAHDLVSSSEWIDREFSRRLVFMSIAFPLSLLYLFVRATTPPPIAVRTDGRVLEVYIRNHAFAAAFEQNNKEIIIDTSSEAYLDNFDDF